MAILKLLVVEDHIPSLELMTEVFTSLSADVRPFSDSRQAAALIDIDKEKFDGIFLDLEMPNLDGFQLAQKVRQSARNKSTPVVIVTGREQRDTMRQSFSTGATFFLQKPVDRRKLTTLFRTVRGPLFENRRHHLRVPLQTQITCNVGSRTLKGRTWNLSQGGIQIEVGSLKEGDSVRLLFALPRSASVIEATGVVAWTKEDRQGLNFTQVSMQSQQAIREFRTQIELTTK
jgi:CheY-like chemotaxis protein